MKNLFALITIIILSGAIVAEAAKPSKSKKAEPAATKAAAPAATAAPAAKPAETPLIKLTTVEAAFLKTLNTRNETIRYIANENAKLAKASEAEKKQIEANLDVARKNLGIIEQSMEIVFGIDNRRNYEYNQTTGNIYLKVGSVNESFARALQKRTALANHIVRLQEAYKKETDNAKKEAIQKENQLYTNALNQVANALFVVYQIHPKRQYQFDAKSGTIYVVSNAEEVAKLKKQAEELNKKQAEEAQKKAQQKK